MFAASEIALITTVAAIVNRFRAPDNPWPRPVAEPRNDL
jgi:hypothetical protein